MSELRDKTFEIISSVLIALIFFALGFVVGKTIGFKDGQINALSGKIEYKLITNPDSTRTWEYINEV